MKQIRTTMLNAHFMCPLRYKRLEETGGIPETDAIRLGTKVHSILADMNKGIPVSLSPLSPEERILVKNATIFVERHPVVEVSMTMPISSEWELEGTADVIVEKENLIHDYKTGYVSYPVKSSLQLFLYWYLYSKTVSPLRSAVLTLEFLRDGMQDTLTASPEEVKRIAEKGIEDFLKDSSFEPRPNPFCKYCSFVLECPLLQDLAKNGHGPMKKWAIDVLRYRLTRLARGADLAGSESIGSATAVVVREEVEKVNVKTALSMLTPEEITYAVKSIDPNKLPEFVRAVATEKAQRTKVVLDYDVTK